MSSTNFTPDVAGALCAAAQYACKRRGIGDSVQQLGVSAIYANLRSH